MGDIGSECRRKLKPHFTGGKQRGGEERMIETVRESEGKRKD